MVNLSTYNIGDINKLLDFLITYYRKKENNNHNVLNIQQPPIKDNQSNSNYSNSSTNISENTEKDFKNIGDLKQEYLEFMDIYQ